MTHWQTRRFRVDLNTPKIMGIVNMTPDSFSDGGTYSRTFQAALKHAESLLADGANILDIGGESTRPNCTPVSPEQEWQRIQPILAEVSRWNVPISLDTRRTMVMQRALDADFVDIINDVQALEDTGALNVVAQSKVGICLMHMRGLPENMQHNPQYSDVVHEVSHYLHERANACLNAGIAAERITLDPGFGFGKTLAHNLRLMKNLDILSTPLALPLLIGVSRKRMIGEMTQHDIPAKRISGSVTAALFAIQQGAKIVRVHDVRETVDAIKVWQALEAA